ncbi:MAG: ATP-dependent Clp protease proteolytic subunit [Rhodopila sp.]
MMRAGFVRWHESEGFGLPHAVAARDRFDSARTSVCPSPMARRVIRILAAVTLSIACPNSASAMVFKVIAPDGERPALSMSGEILPGDTARVLPLFIRLSEGDIAPRLFLNSPGGNILEATQLANVIHEARMPVFVQAGDMCASACFLLFAASPSRHAAPDAMIGVHSASFDGNENGASLMLDTAMARKARAFGVPPDVIGRMVTTAPSEMAWLTSDELREMDVRQIDATQQAIPAPAPNPIFNQVKVALAKPSPLQVPGAAHTNATSEPWDGITYRPAQFGPGAQSPAPERPQKVKQPTFSIAAVQGASDKPDYVARGFMADSAPVYVPGR